MRSNTIAIRDNTPAIIDGINVKIPITLHERHKPRILCFNERIPPKIGNTVIITPIVAQIVKKLCICLIVISGLICLNCVMFIIVFKVVVSIKKKGIQNVTLITPANINKTPAIVVFETLLVCCIS